MKVIRFTLGGPWRESAGPKPLLNSLFRCQGALFRFNGPNCAEFYIWDVGTHGNTAHQEIGGLRVRLGRLGWTGGANFSLLDNTRTILWPFDFSYQTNFSCPNYPSNQLKTLIQHIFGEKGSEFHPIWKNKSGKTEFRKIEWQIPPLFPTLPDQELSNFVFIQLVSIKRMYLYNLKEIILALGSPEGQGEENKTAKTGPKWAEFLPLFTLSASLALSNGLYFLFLFSNMITYDIILLLW